MTRDPFRSHESKMERMRRARERMEVLFWILFAVFIFCGVAVLLFLMTHPEAIGAFFGRIAAGAELAK